MKSNAINCNLQNLLSGFSIKLKPSCNSLKTCIDFYENILQHYEIFEEELKVLEQKRIFKMYSRYNGLVAYFLVRERLRGNPRLQRIFLKLKVYNHVHNIVVCQFY